MMPRLWAPAVWLVFASATIGVAPAGAQDAPALRKLLGCKAIVEAAARLSCYDERARDVDDAIARRDLVVADREQVAATRRSLFGLALPRIPLLEDRPGDGKAAAAPERLDTTIKSASRSGDRWTLVLAEGGRWEQVEAGREADEPSAGMPVSIRRASFGTYFARIGQRISMRIKRVG